MKQRKPYRPDQASALSRIEADRLRLKITQDDLASAAGITSRSYRRMMTAGRAFPRQIRGLSFALRTIADKRKRADRMFAGAAYEF